MTHNTSISIGLNMEQGKLVLSNTGLQQEIGMLPYLIGHIVDTKGHIIRKVRINPDNMLEIQGTVNTTDLVVRVSYVSGHKWLYSYSKAFPTRILVIHCGRPDCTICANTTEFNVVRPS
jgi:hypothetical protein